MSRVISGIYRNQPVSRGVNKSQVWNDRESGKNRKPRTNSSVKGADVFLVTGMLSLRTIRHNSNGYFVSVNGTDYPVRQLGNVWVQDRVSLDSLRLALHPKERQDRGHVNRPIPYREGHCTSKVSTFKVIPSKQRNLKTPIRDLAAQPTTDMVNPNYKMPVVALGGGASQEFKDRIAAKAGVTPELEAWLKTIGK